MDNTAYALVQAAHNLGAALALGSAWTGRVQARSVNSHAAAALPWVLAAWLAQIATGALFGGMSLYFYGGFPDIHGIAAAALAVKIACATTGAVLAVAFWNRHRRGGLQPAQRAWDALITLAVIALVAAAFLRWFS